MFAKYAWDKIEGTETEPPLVLAHPDMPSVLPQAYPYYRGITLLSQNRVSGIACTIDKWETERAKPQVTKEMELRLSQLNDTFINSLILDKTDWALENGYRNILVSIGIASDGSVKNVGPVHIDGSRS